MTKKTTTLQGALGREKRTHTLVNRKGEELTIELVNASLVEIVELQESQKDQSPAALLQLVIDLLVDRSNKKPEEVRAWLRAVNDQEEFGRILNIVSTGVVPDPKAVTTPETQTGG